VIVALIVLLSGVAMGCLVFAAGLAYRALPGPEPGMQPGLAAQFGLERIVAAGAASNSARDGWLARSGRRFDSILRLAGRPWGGINGVQYVSLLVVVGGGFGAVIAMLLLLLSGGFPAALILGGLVAGLTALFGWLKLHDLVLRRRERITREFPYFLDLLVMSAESGAILHECMELYVESNPYTLFADEVRLALVDEARGGSPAAALEALAGRMISDDVRETIIAIVEAERRGAAKVQAMRDLAAHVRSRRWQAAEDASKAVQTKIILPVMLLAISIMILILGPALLQVTQSFRQ